MILISSQYSFSQTGRLEGHLQDTVENRGFENAFIKINGLSIGAQTDSNGDFEIKNVPVGEYSIEISALGFISKEIEKVQIFADSTNHLNVNYPPKCKYNHNNMTCPTCNKKDEVIPIIYGYPSDRMFRKADKGKIKLGGCVISGCDPKWYCKRDKTEFLVKNAQQQRLPQMAGFKRKELN